MSQTVHYPGDAPTGPQAAVRPESPYPPQFSQGYAYPPFSQVPPQFAQEKSGRLVKVAAVIGIIAGSLVIVAVLFGSGFYFGRETAPRPVERSNAGTEQGGPMIFPMPRGQFDRPGPGIVIPNMPNGPTFQLPNIFPQFPVPPQPPTTQVPGQPPR